MFHTARTWARCVLAIFAIAPFLLAANPQWPRQSFKPWWDCQCKCAPLPPPPAVLPPPPAAYEVRSEPQFPLRWSWVHWWEAHRESYLPEPQAWSAAGATQPASHPADLRDKAVESLKYALASKSPHLRAAAALALGQIGAPSAIETIRKLLTDDPDPGVQEAARTSLAVLENARSGSGLTLGLALDKPPQPGDNPDTELQKLAQSADSKRALAAARALRDRNAAESAKFFRALLRTTANPWLASEAILALGQLADGDDVALIADILLAGPNARMLPAWQALEAGRNARMRLSRLANIGGTQQQAMNEYLARHRQWARYASDYLVLNRKPSGVPGEKTPPDVVQNVPIGLEEIYLGHLRTAAAIALGSFDERHARMALGQALAQRGDDWGEIAQNPTTLARLNEFSELHKSAALISLGRIGDEQSLALLLQVFAGRISTIPEYTPERMKTSPLRGHAALAIGLYACPVSPKATASRTKPLPVDRPRYQLACKVLGEALLNPAEDPEVRTAAALALGLSSRPDALRGLQKLQLGASTDPALFGFTLLARALLHDVKVAELAQAFLTQEEPSESIGGVLGRRAAVLALGVLGTPDTIPVLRWALDRSYFVGREAGRALAQSRAYAATDELLKLLQAEEQPRRQVIAARTLGELFASQRPDALSRLLGGGNHALRNDSFLPLQMHANEFLFGALVPALNSFWP